MRMVWCWNSGRKTVLTQPHDRRYGYAQNICYALSSAIVVNEASGRNGNNCLGLSNNRSWLGAAQAGVGPIPPFHRFIEALRAPASNAGRGSFQRGWRQANVQHLSRSRDGRVDWLS
jgi:hypothetical protein